MDLGGRQHADEGERAVDVPEVKDGGEGVVRGEQRGEGDDKR